MNVHFQVNMPWINTEQTFKPLTVAPWRKRAAHLISSPVTFHIYIAARNQRLLIYILENLPFLPGTLNMWRDNELRSRVAEVQLFNCALDWLLLLFGTIPSGNSGEKPGSFLLFSCQGYRSCLVACCVAGSGDLCANLLMRL